MKNKLLFVQQEMSQIIYRSTIRNDTGAFILAVHGSTLHHLWHHRLGHPSKTITNNVHKSCNGVSSLHVKNPFQYCDACVRGKITKLIKGHNNDTHNATHEGDRFQLDYSFVRVSYLKEGGTPGLLITSIDDCNAYLLITSEVHRQMWLLTTRGRGPPIDIINSFLDKYKRTDGKRDIRTDLGGELAINHAFQALFKRHNYVLIRLN